MPDPNFNLTVILVLAHQGDGALGVVLNRPSERDVESPLPQWEKLVADPPVVFVGGPVAPSAAICLARLDAAAAADAAPPPPMPFGEWPPDGSDLTGTGGWMPLVGDLGTLDLERDPDDLAVRVGAIRVFAGYAGWGRGQLEGEVAAGAWFVVPAESGDALAGDPGQLWKRVLRRQGGRLALVAGFPPDPSLN
jgi:putative transcriptional regulator